MPPGPAAPSPAPSFTWLPSSRPGRGSHPTQGHSSPRHTRGTAAGIHHQTSPRGRSCYSWVLSSQAHSVGRNPSLHHRYPLAGIEGRAGGSLGHGSQACSVPCTGSRSSRAGTPGRSHPQVSRAGCACSTHSCARTGIHTSPLGRDPGSSYPGNLAHSCNTH